MKKYIYGAGKYGKALYEFWKFQGVKIDGFVTSDGRLRDDMKTQVFSPDVIKVDDIVYIAIGNIEIRWNVITNLLLRGIPIYAIVDCGDWIYKNNIANEHQNYCILCGSHIKKFADGGLDYSLFHQKKIVGGGRRKNCLCHKCGSTDRERWIYYVLKKHTKIMETSGSILHFAPEKCLTERILSENTKCKYYSGDIEPNRALYKVDITDIRFGNEAFDYIIANHILEHIENERLALNELCRVLRNDGEIIISFPVCKDEKTVEYAHADSKEMRIQLYGQEDHVRLYGNDFVERLEGLSEFIFEQHSPYMELSNEAIEQYGFIREDMILIGRKRSAKV